MCVIAVLEQLKLSRLAGRARKDSRTPRTRSPSWACTPRSLCATTEVFGALK